MLSSFSRYSGIRQVEHMSVSVLEDWDGSDEYEDITNQTQYAGGKGSNEFDDL